MFPERSSSNQVAAVFVVGNAVKVYLGNKEVNQIEVKDDFSKIENLYFVVNKLKLKLDEDDTTQRLYWTGEYSREGLKVDGASCVPVHPSHQSTNDGVSYYFDKAFLADISVHLELLFQQQGRIIPSAYNANTSLAPELHRACKICRKKISLKDMRTHICSHIMKGNINLEVGACGFCGLYDCPQKTRVNHKGSEKFCKLMESGCTYYCDYGSRKKFNKKSHQCTN